MNVTTFAPTSRRRIALPTGALSNIFKKIISNPKRIAFTVIALLAAFGLYTIFFGGSETNTATKILPLKQSFEVTAKTKDGKNTNGDFKVDVTGTFRAESLLVQGQRVAARNGKEFLVVNMEISNPYNVALYTYPVDTFRLLGVDGKKYAPTAHQGNVEVRPQSTKTSNVGFIVPQGTKKFKVEIGELTGEKVLLEFSLPN